MSYNSIQHQDPELYASMMRELERQRDHIELIAANPNFKPIRIDANSDFQVWGVVTYVIKKA